MIAEYKLNTVFLEELKDFEIISFALEGVLLDEFDGTLNPFKEIMQEMCKECVKQGKQVIIYTKRYDYDDEEESNEIQKIYDFCEKLKVTEVIFTNRNVFYSYMSNNRKHCHFNNSEYDIVLLNKYKPDIETLNINNQI